MAQGLLLSRALYCVHYYPDLHRKILAKNKKPTKQKTHQNKQNPKTKQTKQKEKRKPKPKNPSNPTLRNTQCFRLQLKKAAESHSFSGKAQNRF